MDARKPLAEIAVDEPLLRELLREQCPALADEPLSRVDEGWDNVTYRVGEGYAARLPRHEVAARLLENEQRWLPALASRLDVAVPVPLHVGRPRDGFPWPWSVVSWIPGTTADVEPLGTGTGRRLGIVLRALHEPAPDDAPLNPFRGVPLRERAPLVEARLATTDLGPVEETTLRSFWRAGLEAPEAAERVWLHGDLHPRNVVGRDRDLVGLIDWGDMNGGDGATDLAAAWTLLRSGEERRAFWAAYGWTEPRWLRARAWAVLFATALATSGEPTHEALGHTIVRELLQADAGRTGRSAANPTRS